MDEEDKDWGEDRHHGDLSVVKGLPGEQCVNGYSPEKENYGEWGEAGGEAARNAENPQRLFGIVLYRGCSLGYVARRIPVLVRNRYKITVTMSGKGTIHSGPLLA